MNIWIDNTNPAPNGFTHCKNIKEAMFFIKEMDKYKEVLEKKAEVAGTLEARGNSPVFTRTVGEYIEECKINLIDIKASTYGYNKLLNWLKETGRNYDVQFHPAIPNKLLIDEIWAYDIDEAKEMIVETNGFMEDLRKNLRDSIGHDKIVRAISKVMCEEHLGIIEILEKDRRDFEKWMEENELWANMPVCIKGYL